MTELEARPQPTWVVAATVIAAFVAFLWALELVDTLLSNRLDGLGVEPRSLDGLWGIVFAPVLHGGWAHLISNTLPLLVLGFVVLLSGLRTWLVVTAVVWLVGGVGVWLVAGGSSIHLGASVLVFGWLVYLIIRGVFTRSLTQIAVGVGVLVIYGSVLWGVLPGRPGVSWQGHLFGAIGGLLAAWVLAERDDAP